MFEKALELIKAHGRIIIHRHTNPDGDAIGAQTGLYFLIKSNFPEKEVYCVGDDPKRYAFMFRSAPDEIDDALYENALAVVLDTSSKELISDPRWQNAAQTLRIDHHIMLSQIAGYEIVDTSYESCAGMIADFARESKLLLTPEAAKALFTGMVTDSGRFLYDSTTPRTFELAAYLTSADFKRDDIFKNLYANDFKNVRNRAAFIMKIQFTKNNVAYIYTAKEEFASLDMDVFSVSRGMVNTMADIKGVDIWVNFTETDEGVLCEIRSSSKNVNPVAVKYGGGGHAKACGATLPDKATAMKLLEDLDGMCGE
ncbi:MAG: bifunctional oligoribonuclease/PAP phosphatase NrnA [Clostridia bacterium]|nr:bifunctional oligoribonuclease/PAP phosphatase NrnA [Clostridia bacterium]